MAINCLFLAWETLLETHEHHQLTSPLALQSIKENMSLEEVEKHSKLDVWASTIHIYPVDLSWVFLQWWFRRNTCPDEVVSIRTADLMLSYWLKAPFTQESQSTEILLSNQWYSSILVFDFRATVCLYKVNRAANLSPASKKGSW